MHYYYHHHYHYLHIIIIFVIIIIIIVITDSVNGTFSKGYNDRKWIIIEAMFIAMICTIWRWHDFVNKQCWAFMFDVILSNIWGCLWKENTYAVQNSDIEPRLWHSFCCCLDLPFYNIASRSCCKIKNTDKVSGKSRVVRYWCPSLPWLWQDKQRQLGMGQQTRKQTATNKHIYWLYIMDHTELSYYNHEKSIYTSKSWSVTVFQFLFPCLLHRSFRCMTENIA